MMKKLIFKIGLICLVTTTLVFSNTFIAKGIQTSNNDEVAKTDINKVHNFIIDAPVKCYNDIKKLEQVSDFKFKVPDFIPKGSKVVAYQLRKLSEKCNAVEIFFENANGSFSFQIFQGDPVEALKIIEKDKIKAIENTQIVSKKEPMNISGIKGLNIALTTIFPARNIDNNNFKGSQSINKYYVWQDNNLWYSMEYYSTSISDEYTNLNINLSQDTLLKIVKSIVFPEEKKNVNYLISNNESEEIPVMNIYDNDDIEKARDLLQFNPKFPLKINENINITNSILGLSRNNKDADKLNYELISFYTNQNGSIIFKQGKNSSDYEFIKKNGYITDEKSEKTQIKVDVLNFNNMEVFKYSPVAFAPQINYIWKEKNVCYSVTLFVNITNSDEIIKGFINSKQIM